METLAIEFEKSFNILICNSKCGSKNTVSIIFFIVFHHEATKGSVTCIREGTK